MNISTDYAPLHTLGHIHLNPVNSKDLKQNVFGPLDCKKPERMMGIFQHALLVYFILMRILYINSFSSLPTMLMMFYVR